MNPAPLDAPQPELDEETRALLDETTTRMVNRAIERRFESEARASQAERAAARRLWPMALAAAAVVLAVSMLWLVYGASH
jgi:cytochrome c-type biogenesis protein CcmH/NrfG